MRRTPKGKMLIVKISYRKPMHGGSYYVGLSFVLWEQRMRPVYAHFVGSGLESPIALSLGWRSVMHCILETSVVFYGMSSGEYTRPPIRVTRPMVFRRCAAQELKDSGSQWPIGASVGQWVSLFFKGYVAPLRRNVERGGETLRRLLRFRAR